MAVDPDTVKQLGVVSRVLDDVGSGGPATLEEGFPVGEDRANMQLILDIYNQLPRGKRGSSSGSGGGTGSGRVRSVVSLAAAKQVFECPAGLLGFRYVVCR